MLIELAELLESGVDDSVVELVDEMTLNKGQFNDSSS